MNYWQKHGRASAGSSFTRFVTFLFLLGPQIRIKSQELTEASVLHQRHVILKGNVDFYE
jgi:hypothetical protein